MPTGVETGQQLVEFRDQCRRVLNRVKPDHVLILDPEPTGQLSYKQSRGRVTGETLLALAAAEAEIPCDRMSRATVRSRVGLDRSGRLSDRVAEVLPTPPCTHWKGKRDLAALVARAGA